MFISYRLPTTRRTRCISSCANSWPCHSSHQSTLRRPSYVWMVVHQRFSLQWWTICVQDVDPFFHLQDPSLECVHDIHPDKQWCGGVAQPPEHQCCHQGIGSFLPSSARLAQGSNQHHSSDENGVWRQDTEVPKEEDLTGGRSCVSALEWLLREINKCEWTVERMCFRLWTTSFVTCDTLVLWYRDSFASLHKLCIFWMISNECKNVLNL